MWETISTVLSSLQPGQLFIILLLLIAGAFWFLPRLRRDKNGKLYIYSDQYEMKHQTEKLDTCISAISKNHECINEIKETNAKQDLSIQRLEIMSLIQNSPEQAALILQKYDEYKKAGGNSYIDSLIEDWRNKK